MNKTELIAKVAAATGMTKKDAGVAVNAVFSVITEALEEGIDVKIVGFGKFEIVKKEEKTQLAFGKEVIVPAHNVVKFRPSDSLKNEIA